VPLQVNVAAAAVSMSIVVVGERTFEFQMFQRSKDYYSFYPAIRFQRDRDE
jgi:hypothetical protein